MCIFFTLVYFLDLYSILLAGLGSYGNPSYLNRDLWNQALGKERKIKFKCTCTSEREINPQESKIFCFCGRKTSNGFLIQVFFPSKLSLEIQKAKSRKKLLLHFGFAFVKAQNCFPFCFEHNLDLNKIYLFSQRYIVQQRTCIKMTLVKCLVIIMVLTCWTFFM